MNEEEVQALQTELETTRTELEGIKTEKEALASDKETLTGELETKATAITEVEQTLATKDRRNRYPEAGGG